MSTPSPHVIAAVKRIRLLAGDIDGGDESYLLTTAEFLELIELHSYPNSDGDTVYSEIEVAQAFLRIRKGYNVDTFPERATADQIRIDELDKLKQAVGDRYVRELSDSGTSPTPLSDIETELRDHERTPFAHGTPEKGDKGDTGPAGPTGAQGPRGRDGAQGPIGPAGAEGPAGEPGQRGERGPAGNVGATGARGPIGPDGARGPQGLPGRDGEAGRDGRDGQPGAPGAQGRSLEVCWAARTSASTYCRPRRHRYTLVARRERDTCGGQSEWSLARASHARSPFRIPSMPPN